VRYLFSPEAIGKGDPAGRPYSNSRLGEMEATSPDGEENGGFRYAAPTLQLLILPDDLPLCFMPA